MVYIACDFKMQSQQEKVYRDARLKIEVSLYDIAIFNKTNYCYFPCFMWRQTENVRYAVMRESE